MAIFPGSAIPSAAEDYTIDNSLRFEDSDNAYLARTPSSGGNLRTWTWSGWVKRGNITAWHVPFSAGRSSPEDRTEISFESADNIRIFQKDSGSTAMSLVTTQVFRDPSAWYHIVLAMDTTQAVDTNRVKLYVNGSQVTSFSTTTYPTQNLDTWVNSTAVPTTIGTDSRLYSADFDGYLAEVYLIDGTQYAASDFGELSSTTNQWKPKDASGLTFGTNGFYQKYNSTELATSFTDSSDPTTWTAPAGITSVDYLVVGGGGGGGSSIPGATASGYNAGGGGGAGGMLTGTLTVVPGTAYTITVGDGGTAGSASSGGDAGDSVFASITATGGGGGGRGGSAGRAGGSSGGSGSNAGAAASGTSGQGNTGGTANAWGGGGGGGASANGTNGDTGTYSYGGPGGAGTASSITGSSVTYSGGGGGGSTAGDNNASGGAGGGGTGGSYNHIDATAGAANTGGGGGGAGGVDASTALNGAAGGSGIVVLDDGTTVTSFTSSRSAHTITANGDVTNTRAVRKIGDSSIKFDGTEDFLRSVDSADWDFISSGTTDYTAEFWIQLSDHTGYNELISQGSLPATANPDENLWTLTHSDGTGLAFKAFESNIGIIATAASGEITDSNWHHIAVVRETNDYTVYLDGTGGTTLTDSSTTTFDGPLQINGRAQTDGTSAYEFNGYLDEIRISNSARYTGNFTPSTTAFTADVNTLLLIHSNWTGGLGADSSGNYNNFTPTNLVATDQMIDTPTNNFCTMNPVYIDREENRNITFSEGNLKWSSGGDSYGIGTIGVSTGKWYWEFYINTISLDNNYFGAIRAGEVAQNPSFYYTTSTNSVRSTGQTDQTGVTGASNGDIVGVALNLDASPQTGAIYLNNVQLGSSMDLTSGTTWTPWLGNANPSTTKTHTLNCGQDSSFAGSVTAQGNQDGNEVGDFYYAPPSTYLALCTSNLPDPEIALPGDNFNTILYDDGTGAKTGVGFQPDLTWVKSRGSSYDHKLTDSVRGVTKAFVSNDNTAETTDSTGLTAFGTDGFTVGADADYSDTTGTGMVAWSWKGGGAAVSNGDGDITSSVSANTTAGFSIVSYTGDGANTSSVGHGLATTPGMIFLKALTGTNNWIVWHKDLTATTAYSLYLNTDGAETNNVSYWYDAAPNATTFHPGDGGASNGSGTAYIAYCFESIEGYSKLGSYDGNGNADGPFIYTGFRPSYIMIRVAPSWAGGHWHLFDTKRYTYNETTNTTTTGLTADNATNDGGGGGEGAGPIDILSNGFKIRNNNGNDNANGDNILYMAFAESPFKTSNAR